MPITPEGNAGRLADELAIRTLHQNYFHGVDSKDFELFGSVFDEDTVFDFRAATDPPQPVLHGRDEIIPFVRETLAGITTVHHGFLRELAFTGLDRARGLWAMEDILWRGEPGQLEVMLHGWGHYHADYRKVDDAWRISSISLTRIHVQTH